MQNAYLLLLCSVLVLQAGSTAFAQQSVGTIAGRVTARNSGQAIAMAEIRITDSVSSKTDSSGNFKIEVPAGVYNASISANGFSPVIVSQIGVTGGRMVLLNLELDVTLREDVEVRSETFEENSEQIVSNQTLRREDLRTTPGSGGDPLRAINSLPAVTAASGEFADLIVRGGTAEENLTFIDKIPVGDFTYFTDKYDGNRGGRAAILPPDTVDRAEFSVGGFGVRYGDRMSSALDVSLREANRDKVQGVIFADSGTAGGSIDVPLLKKGSWLFSARRSYIDVALDVAGIADLGIIGYPRTFDFTNKFVFDITPRHKLSFTALDLFETFDQTDEQAVNIDRRTDRFRTRRTSQRNIFGATLSSSLGTKTLAQTTAWLKAAHNDGSFFLPYFSFPQRTRDLRDSQTGIKEEVTTSIRPKLDAAFGGGIYFDSANYYTFEERGTFYSPLEEEFNAQRRENRLQLGSTASTFAYGQLTWGITPKFSVVPGIRIDHYGLTGETLVSPRIGARLNIAPQVALTFAAGIYRQPPGLFVLSLTPENRDLKSQTSKHLIAGIEWLAREDTRFRVEGYMKEYDDLIVQPLRPTQNFALDGNYFNSGSGSARGLEISIQKTLSGFFSGQASYAFTHSKRRYEENGPEFPSDFDRTHQLTLIGITRFYGFSVAAKYRAATGLPYTRRTPVQPFPNALLFIQRIQNSNDINALRLPLFASLDLRGEKRFSFRRWSFSPYIDVFNVTNHRSVVQPNYEFYSARPQFLGEDRRLPLFGLRIEF